MFFVDKYNPKTLEESVFHNDILEQLKIISSDNSIPHLIFHGPKGSGKKTIIRLFLMMLFGKSASREHNIIYTITGSGNNSTEVKIKQSKHHIVIEPYNTNFDKYLVNDIVKKYAKTTPIDIFMPNRKSFKIIFIKDIDKLSYYAQTSLRRTMEIYSKNCRFVMLSHSLSKVINPLISRCLCIKINSPSDKDIFRWIYSIGSDNNISMNLNSYSDIINKSNGNLKTALWKLELCKYKLDYNTTFDIMINKIVEMLILFGTRAIMDVRDAIYKIIITNISGTAIITNIVLNLINNNDLTNEDKREIIKAGAKYQSNMIQGRHIIIHIEAFIQSIIYTLHIHKTNVVKNNTTCKKNTVEKKFHSSNNKKKETQQLLYK